MTTHDDHSTAYRNSDRVRCSVTHALAELIRIRAELDSTSRLLTRAHILAGSSITQYRAGDLFPTLVLAADSTSEAIAQCSRFLDLQVIAIRDPVDTLADLDEERGTDRVF